MYDLGKRHVARLGSRQYCGMRFPPCLPLLALALPGILAAQPAQVVTGRAPQPTTSRAVRTSTTIRVDGKLDDPAWASAPVTSDFVQIDPEEGKPSVQRTEVRVVYDDE